MLQKDIIAERKEEKNVPLQTISTFLKFVCKLRDHKNPPCRENKLYARKTMAVITANKDVPRAFAILPENTEDST